MSEAERAGAHLRTTINDLKRRPEDAARDLGISLDEMNSLLAGEKPLSAELRGRAAKAWGCVNERDLLLIGDDAPDGVKIMRAEESAASSRVMDRAGKPYYEYRDTAMTRVAWFRPEWILELCEVEDDSPDNPAVQWNRGHLMHQFTYFIGPVNYYYLGPDGKRRVFVTDTGDSVYGTPFYPHTFTTRKNPRGEKGLILALTYGDKLCGDSLQELAALGTELAESYQLDFSSREKAFAGLLNQQIEMLSMSEEELLSRCGLDWNELAACRKGEKIPPPEQLKRLAAALGAGVKDLLPPDVMEEKVKPLKHSEARKWLYPSADAPRYEIVELASTRHLPYSKALELTVLGNPGAGPDLKLPLHQYFYNVGETPVEVKWESGAAKLSELIHPGDSFYMKPFVPHSFEGKGKLVSMRIGGRINGEPRQEYSLYHPKQAHRAVKETLQWFDPKDAKAKARG